MNNRRKIKVKQNLQYNAYVVYRNIISHTVGAISMGHEVLHKKVSLQILNEKIIYGGGTAWCE